MSAVRQFQPLMPFSVPAFAATLFALGLALGTTIAVGMLFFIQVQGFYKGVKSIKFINLLRALNLNASYFQMKVILRNKTSIESWIEEKVQMCV